MVNPGPIGRSLRLVIGAGCLYFLTVLYRRTPSLIGTDVPDSAVVWIGIALGLWALRDVVDVGYRLSVGRWAQIGVTAVLGAIAAFNTLTTGRVWSPVLGTVVLVWLAYEYAHLGVAFVLAGIVGTPG